MTATDLIVANRPRVGKPTHMMRQTLETALAKVQRDRRRGVFIPLEVQEALSDLALVVLTLERCR